MSEVVIFSVEVYREGRHWTEPPSRKALLWSEDFVVNSWGAIFEHYKRKGCDPSDAAYRADQWEKRQRMDRWKNCPSTHCERAQECRSPNDCSASH